MTTAKSKRRLVARSARWRLRADPIVLFSMTIIALSIAFTVSPSIFAPMDPSIQRLSDRLLSPGTISSTGERYWLGTDWLGRDLLSRIIFGTRITVLLALLSVLVRTILGTALGLLGGYFGGVVDAIIMRLVDVQLALPFLLLGLALVSVSGPSIVNVVIVLGVSGWMVSARIVRSQVLAIRESEFVEGARAVGARHPRILMRHVLPNVAGLVLVVATVDIPTVIISESVLSFLGVGVPLSLPSWGAMIAQGRAHLTTSWWVPVLPGAAVAVIAASVAVVGDWLQTHTRRGTGKR